MEYDNVYKYVAYQKSPMGLTEKKKSAGVPSLGTFWIFLKRKETTARRCLMVFEVKQRTYSFFYWTTKNSKIISILYMD